MGVAPVQLALLVIDDHGSWAKELVRILDMRMVKHGNAITTKVLVEWANSFPKDATWEPFQQINDAFPHIDP